MNSPCSEQCLAAAEPLAGSGGSATVWVALAWSRPLWDAEDVADSKGLPGDLGLLADEARRHGDELALIAEAFARTHGLEAVKVRAADTLVTGTHARVRLDADPGGSDWVECEQRAYVGQASCGEEPAEERRRWVARSLQATA